MHEWKKVIKLFKIKRIYYFEKRRFILRYIFDNPKIITEFLEHSKRFYGEPKLDKPKELKGIKQYGSVSYIGKKCTCPIFLKGDDVWIKHNDYFSSSLQPTQQDVEDTHSFVDLEYMTKKYLGKTKKAHFIYPDAFGGIVLKNQAWICLKDIIIDIRNGVHQLDLSQEIVSQATEFYGFDILMSTMERFYYNVVNYLYKEAF